MRRVNMEKMYEEILSLVEEFINELDDETVKSTAEKRQQAVSDAQDEFLKTIRDKSKSQEEAEAAALKGYIADKKLHRNKELTSKRDYRIQKKVEDFKNKLLNRKPQTAKETQKAASDHANAMIDQHFRNKLEKSLAVSNECFESLISLIEGELINFQEKRKQKVLDRNAEKMAQMMQDGSLNAVRVLPNKELIGDPAAIKKVKDIQAENEEVIRKCRKHG